MALDRNYCVICKQEITIGSFNRMKSYRFEDGVYCEACATAKVKKERSKL